jgi:GNAT superfamily N-acetyltransferase
LEDLLDLKREDFDQNPEKVITQVTMRSGESATLRPLRAEDSRRLGDYFLSLAQRTRDVYSPHAFDQETADQLCVELDSTRNLRMLALVDRDGKAQIAAYFIIKFYVSEGDAERLLGWGIPVSEHTDVQLAPCVADDLQDTGLGSLVLAHLVDLLRRLGIERMILSGGVRQDNPRAVRFYEKFGFRKVAEYTTTVANYQMIADLQGES